MGERDAGRRTIPLQVDMIAAHIAMVLRGTAHAREAYNPHTGRYGGRVTASNAYGSWGRSVVSGKDGVG